MPLPNIAPNYNKQALTKFKYHDLDQERKKPAQGLTDAVRATLTEEIISENSIGVVGWTFKQYGLNYACQIKDEHNNDVYSFGLEIPKGQEYLHRQAELTIDEKLHILKVIEQSLAPDKSSQHQAAFFGLEKACFDPSAGIVKPGPRTASKAFIPQGFVTGHCGLSFADDHLTMMLLENKMPLDAPQPNVLLLEWEMDQKRYVIDCSEGLPRFRLGYSVNPNMQLLNMTRAEATMAVKYARAKVNMSGQAELARLCGVTGLWPRLEAIAEWAPENRQPI